MNSAVQSHFLSVEDYLTEEQLGDIKHDYIAGQVYAMEGASRGHNRLSGRLVSKLEAHLGSGPCTPFIGDMKVRLQVRQGEVFYYPDVVVTCDPKDTEEYFLRFPKLIIEVLSESTERLDRGEKMQNYLSLASLEEYVLVAQDQPEITIHRRRNNWSPEITRGWEGVFQLESVNLQMTLAALYENVLVRD